MKINPNIENSTAESRSLAGRVQSQEAEITAKNFKTVSIQEITSQTAQNFSKKKTYYDVIVITQIAHSFFQKALLLSSSLGKVVSDALTSGKIKQGELSEALTGIRSSLNEIQDEIAPQSSSAPQNYAAVYQFTGVHPDIPHINTEVNSLGEIVNGLMSGNMPDLKRIDRITDSLSNKASNIENLLNQFVMDLQFPVKRLDSNLTAEKSSGLITDTVNLISSYPQAALQSQGNINSEAVKNLI
jgi:hypothetical protein